MRVPIADTWRTRKHKECKSILNSDRVRWQHQSTVRAQSCCSHYVVTWNKPWRDHGVLVRRRPNLFMCSWLRWDVDGAEPRRTTAAKGRLMREDPLLSQPIKVLLMCHPSVSQSKRENQHQLKCWEVCVYGTLQSEAVFNIFAGYKPSAEIQLFSPPFLRPQCDRKCNQKHTVYAEEWLKKHSFFQGFPFEQAF